MKIINASLSSLFGALLVFGLFQGCHDSPVGTETSDNIFPSDKLSLTSEDMPEVEFYASENGIEISEVVTPRDLHGSARSRDGRGNQSGNQGREHDGREHAGPAQLFMRILATLDLNERQQTAIARCFEAHEACVESATTRARSVRTELHDRLVAKITRVRNAVEDGSLTRQEGHRLIVEALKEYRKSAIELSKKYHEALRACATDLRECVEGFLTPEQLRRFRALLDQASDHADDGRKDADREKKRKDDKRKDRDHEGDDDDGDDDGRGNGRGE